MTEKLKDEIVRIFGKKGDTFETFEKHGFPSVDKDADIEIKCGKRILQISKECGNYILFIKNFCSINISKDVEDIAVEENRIVIEVKDN